MEVGEWIPVFGIEHLLDKPLLQLSNGENKRLQIVKALGQKPDWLLLDNPYLGLDVSGRAILSAGLTELSQRGIRFILFLSGGGELPGFVNKVYHLPKQASVVAFSPRLMSWLGNKMINPSVRVGDSQRADEIISLKDVTIRYGSQTILEHFSWTIQRGERWVLRGPNGAGKSTLLSLITADNPQSYSQDITLFGRRRGTGESIWDIKKNIGYVSPEMHLYFKETGTSFAVVASGLFDLLGVTRKVNEQQNLQVDTCLALFGLEYLRDRSFQALSTGEQKMVLIARAFVKNPPLLILDEPCQGLDAAQVRLLKDVINQIADCSDMTLIFVSHYAEDVPECIGQVMEL
jgi:molybdate transport system ATP-binding protein